MNNFKPVDFSSLNRRDAKQIALQRTSQLAPGVLGAISFRLWNAGFPAILALETALRRESIFRGAMADIEKEVGQIETFVRSRQMPVRRLVDIGCGHALADLLFHRTFDCSLHLVDIEATDSHHHDFHSKGSGYASLSSARRFLETNGVAADQITTTNPDRQPLVDAGCDMIVSMLSCGFHYPLETYVPFAMEALRPGGCFIFDLRKNSGQDDVLHVFGETAVIFDHSKYSRIAAVKH